MALVARTPCAVVIVQDAMQKGSGSNRARMSRQDGRAVHCLPDKLHDLRGAPVETGGAAMNPALASARAPRAHLGDSLLVALEERQVVLEECGRARALVDDGGQTAAARRPSARAKCS